MGNLIAFILMWIVLISAFGIGLLLIPVYWLLVIRGSAARAIKAEDKLKSTLIDGEQIRASAFQMRISSLMSRRLLLVATSSRVVLIDRSIFGGFDMKDYQWKDLQDARLAENTLPNWFGSRLDFKIGKSPLTINGIKCDIASQVYKESQRQEQEWEEKRRVRKLEEVRAASGATILHAGGMAPNGSAPADALEEIRKAKEMLDTAIISDSEFNEIKAKILSRGQF